MSTGKTIDALVLTKPGHPTENFKLGQVTLPALADDEVLVKINVTALNPVDWKQAAYGFLIQSPLPIPLGTDLAGVVEAVGANVKQHKIGDEVWAFPGLGKLGRGTFATHAILREGALGHRPKDWSFEQASTLGVGFLTAYWALQADLGLDLSPLATIGGDGDDDDSKSDASKNKDEFVLVWGASSAVGSYATQIAAAAGYTVVAVAGAKNHEYVKSLGAAHVFDYRSESVVDDIRKATGGKLRYAVDVAGGEENVTRIANSLTTDEKTPTIISEVADGRPKDPPKNLTVKGAMLGTKPDDEAGFQWIKQAYKWSDAALATGKIKPNNVRSLEGGLGGIVAGLELLAAHKVSAEKLVVRIQ